MEPYDKLNELDERMRVLERVVSRLQGGVILAGFVFSFVVAIITLLGNAHLNAIWTRGIDANKTAMETDRKAFQELNQKNLEIPLKAVDNMANRQTEAMREIFSGNAHRDEKVGQLLEMVVRQEANYDLFKRQVERTERIEMMLGELRSDTMHMRKELDRSGSRGGLK